MDRKLFSQLVNELLKIKSRSVMENFLLGLLTPQELEKIPKRVQIVKMLKKKIPQHEIAEKLGIGVATVTRGSRELKLGRFKNI